MEEHLKREHSLAKPYQGVGSSTSSLWELMGNAMVMTHFIRLTPDVQSKQGAVWNRVPCYLRDWEMQVHFKIHGQGKKNLNGDGFAMWYTKDRMQPGPVFGSKDNFLGLGVFVDTYPNEEKQQEAQKKRYSSGNQRVFPYVSAMVSNGSLAYDHARDGRPTELGGCTAMVRNLQHDTFLVIRYVKRRLTVLLDIDGKNEWRDCVDIPGVHLPRGYYFGVSSVTGDLSAVPADSRADARGGAAGQRGLPSRGGQHEAARIGDADGAHEWPGSLSDCLLLAGRHRVCHRHRHYRLQQMGATNRHPGEPLGGRKPAEKSSARGTPGPLPDNERTWRSAKMPGRQ
ncbi:VIP36-like protein isoform X4 [Varanus komodoensis]|uniref:VIP36-like protein isoform X4 n=1 Tax=Varanus komodoensis TaxID=61221 RepID=UPI001CF7DDEF|nr:VIP36-like protein isoform X4 [Varanus komodoensis]